MSPIRSKALLIFAVTGIACSLSAHAFDAQAAKDLARVNYCLKCHGVSKDKDGPAYRKIAEKYRGKPEAEEKLTNHITSGEKVRLPDGREETHFIVKTHPPHDVAQVKNLIEWILSLEAK